MSTEKTYDIIIIGAGINGAAIARDAAGRGLSVCLLEKGELGRATSSASTKLIHGGLRYLMTSRWFGNLCVSVKYCSKLRLFSISLCSLFSPLKKGGGQLGCCAWACSYMI